MPEQLILRRRLGKKTSDEKIEAQVDYIIGRGLKGARGTGWEVEKRRHPARKNGDWWEFRFDLSFDKVKGRGRGTDTEYRQWEAIKAMIIQTGAGTKFGEYPWEVFKGNGDGIGMTADSIRASQQEARTVNALANLGGAPLLNGPPPAPPDNPIIPDANAASIGDVVSELSAIVSKIGGVREVQTTFSVVKSWPDLQIPPELLGRESDFHLTQHPAWAELYGVGAQIRTVLSNIKRAHDTDGRSRNHGVLYGHAGCGKAQPLNATVYTPTGPKKMGEINVGDTVSTPTGYAKVIGVYPQPKQNIYRMFFSDESFADCTGEHLWKVNAPPGCKSGVMDTNTIAAHLKTPKGRRRYSIPMTKPVEFAVNEHFIHPYLLGILIAEGSYRSKSVTVTVCEKEIYDRISNLLPNGYMLKPTGEDRPCDYRISRSNEYMGQMSPLHTELKRMGLWGKEAVEKFIPNEYLFDSIENRLELLRGLMDGDGTVSKTGHITYSTASCRLANDFQSLIQSIGGTCSFSFRESWYTYKGVRRKGKDSIRCNVSVQDGRQIMTLGYKLERVVQRTKYLPNRMIDRIELIGQEEAQCILLDDTDHLYLTDNFVVTHNTTTLLALEEMFGPGAVLRLDATSTTRAGIEKLFFTDLPVIPPLVFMEEAEKADPEALKVWLGALDDRGEIRKVNFRVNQLREVKVLFLCTVNNKTLFDKMMGSDGSEAGALSSRCVSQIYFPRPSDMVLRQILMKEIHRNGGEESWINPALTMAQEMGVTDPRIVRSYLAGGDRLLDGTYQQDWAAIAEAAKTFRKNS